MNRMNAWSAALLIVAVAQLTGCGRKERIYQQIAPADVKEIEGQYAKEVELLSDRAIERIGLEVAEVSKQQGPRKESPQLSVPYSALYGSDSLYVMTEEGRMHRVPVEQVGEVLREGGYYDALVRSERLQQGDLIITTHLPNAIEGLKVAVAEASGAETE